MKYCFACGHVTTGQPFFCSSCGCSYDVKLCPRKHVSPRFADVCSQCGSRELSMPQPKVSIWWKVTEFFIRALLGILLVLLSVGVLIVLLRSSAGQAMLVVLVFLIAALWAFWIMLPEWFRKFVHWLIKRRTDRDE